MMKIKIAERLRPFSHLSGTCCVIPFTAIRLQIFPTLIRLFRYDENPLPTYLGEVSLHLTGPIKDFTMQQDLEKGGIKVWGKSLEGFFRYAIFPVEDTLHLKFDRKVDCTPSLSYTQKENEFIFSLPIKTFSPELNERLSLGNHKLQD